MKNESSTRSRFSMMITNILADIDRGYASITLEEVANKYGYSIDYISRQLKKATGMSFKDYVFEKKLDHASLLLKSTNLSIKAICECCGFPLT